MTLIKGDELTNGVAVVKTVERCARRVAIKWSMR
jgi:hypothetical protein